MGTRLPEPTHRLPIAWSHYLSTLASAEKSNLNIDTTRTFDLWCLNIHAVNANVHFATQGLSGEKGDKGDPGRKGVPGLQVSLNLVVRFLNVQWLVFNMKWCTLAN